MRTDVSSTRLLIQKPMVKQQSPILVKLFSWKRTEAKETELNREVTCKAFVWKDVTYITCSHFIGQGSLCGQVWQWVGKVYPNARGECEYLETVVQSYSIMCTFLCHEKCFCRSSDRNALEKLIHWVGNGTLSSVKYSLEYFRYLCTKSFR